LPGFTTYVFRFSQPLDVLFRPRICRSYFIPDPLTGFTLQSFTPLTQPFAVSGVAPLLALVLPAYHGTFKVGREKKARKLLYAPTLSVTRLAKVAPVFRVLLRVRVRYL